MADIAWHQPLASGRWNSFRSSFLAEFNIRCRSAPRFRPARLISKFSIDMAERNGVDLRRELDSADLFKERAIATGLLSVKTPAFKSIALLLFMTFADHRAPVFFRAPDARREDFGLDFSVAIVLYFRRSYPAANRNNRSIICRSIPIRS